ncbi:YbaK/EbsC family protein [Shewanella psychropiezotolerans]|uniref:YbaK/EbsC family protein n=1 Tax=Shewanella psychropiezotolerans TaxID=2593655 RepID=A0ABX5WZP4_9GAMM|nr:MULTISPECIES: YbaK/EbsC family protein [Shewanella]MPY26264.1 YbaK/EbsC family protein [Shewanella sp. YLB-07]QDO84580.1 YbaK/EbsC family protein [Shewanella psychropiezotolerans]
MGIAITLASFLNHNRVDYSIVKHRKTLSSLDSSASAHLPSAQVIKAVLLVNGEGDYMLAGIGSGHRLSILKVSEVMGEVYQLANEQDLQALFHDCDEGAIPGLAEAYGIKMMLDKRLIDEDMVYIEAGDHCHLIKINHLQYTPLLSGTLLADLIGEPIGTPKFGDYDNCYDKSYLSHF